MKAYRRFSRAQAQLCCCSALFTLHRDKVYSQNCGSAVRPQQKPPSHARARTPVLSLLLEELWSKAVRLTTRTKLYVSSNSSAESAAVCAETSPEHLAALRCNLKLIMKAVCQHEAETALITVRFSPQSDSTELKAEQQCCTTHCF